MHDESIQKFLEGDYLMLSDHIQCFLIFTDRLIMKFTEKLNLKITVKRVTFYRKQSSYSILDVAHSFVTLKLPEKKVVNPQLVLLHV